MKARVLLISILPTVLSIILTAFFLASCSTGSNDLTKSVAGTYVLEGIQINERICLVGCPPERYGEITRSDTFQVAFPVEIYIVESRKDTLLFSGLEGADIPIRHLESSRNATNSNCRPHGNTMPPSLCTYALHLNDKILFDIVTPFGSYAGEGGLSNGELTLTTNYFYRGISVDYHLTGSRK